MMNEGRIAMQTIRHNAMARLRKYASRNYVSEAMHGFASAAAGLICLMLAMPASAQEPSAGPAVKQIASDLYFFFEFDGSNAVFLVTDEGVLLIDTRTHPRYGKDLLDRIRRVTDKPIKWVINSHFHGDHHMGNVVFKDLGATFIAHKDTARIMQHVHPKEMARRIDTFKSRGLDPNEVKLVLPDVTFAGEAAIRLGGREIRLIDLGPGQQAGDTYVHFPHARVLFTPGAFGKKSMPNMAFTPSVDTWVKQLTQVSDMDIDRILPAHGDVATRADVKELAAMLADEYATVKQAVDKRVPVEEAVKTLTFPQYKDWRNYRRLEGEIRALYELIGTGKRSYLE
jgi:glyoxylase-like metal-dependent hydrolase (beta-lactamase superfamily II)